MESIIKSKSTDFHFNWAVWFLSVASSQLSKVHILQCYETEITPWEMRGNDFYSRVEEYQKTNEWE